MAGATDTTIASAINKYVHGVWDTLNSRATPLSDFHGKRTDVTGDSVDWVVNSAGNTSSTTYVAGDAPSAAGYQTYYALTLAKASYQYRTMIQVTGTATDSAKNGYFGVIERELQGGMLDHSSYLEDALVTAQEAAIASGGSYAGQTRANANTASYEDAVTPTVAEMNLAHTEMMQDPRSAVWASLDLLAPIEFQNSYLTVAAGVQYYERNSAQGSPVDAGGLSGIGFGGKLFNTIGTMTDTTCLILGRDNCDQMVWRDIQVDVMAKNDDSTTISLTSVIVPVVWNARLAGKLT